MKFSNTSGTKPEFIEDDVFKTIILLKAKDNEKTVPISGLEEVRRKLGEKFGERFGESSEKILELILYDQNILASTMAGSIGISERAVEKQLAKLKGKGVIDKIGPDKGGYWKINI